MRGILLEDCDWNINDYKYKKHCEIDVTEIDGFNDYYAVYRHDTLDWIPKCLIKLEENV